MATSTLPPTRLQPQPAFAGILRQQETFASGDTDSINDRLNGAFDRLMLQCGWEVGPSIVLMLCLVSAVAVGGAAFVATDNPLLAAVGALAGGALPIVAAQLMRSRRQRLISEQLPGMIDELSRAARTGRSLESCLELVASDTPRPLGSEIQLCVRKMHLGIPIDQAMSELPERTGVVSTSILTTALAVHRQTGGDLIHVLDRLSHTLRDRLQFYGRLKAATTASRLTAILMIGLPPFILLFFVIRDPDYFDNLFASGWGRATTLTAIVLLIIGSIWVLRVLSNSRKP